MDVDKLNREERNKLMKLLKEKAGDDEEESSEKRRMQWMCQNEEADREDYLLGKRIKNIDDLALLDDVSRRYYNAEVGEDILERTAKQDMMAKMHEDPLYLIKNQEDERKKKLLQNTVRLKKLQALVNKQAESKKSKKSKKAKKEKRKRKKKRHSRSSSSSSSSSDDSLLNTYLKLLSSKEASKPDCEEGNGRRGSSRPSDRRRYSSSDEDAGDRRRRSGDRPSRDLSRHYSDRNRLEERPSARYRPPVRELERRRERSPDDRRRYDRRRCSRSPEPAPRSYRARQRSRSPPARERGGGSPRGRCRKRDPEEMARLRQEMMDNAKSRDDERKQRLESHIQELQTEKEKEKETGSANFISSAMMKHASRSSVEDEVKRRVFKRQKMDGGAIHEQASFGRR